MTGNRIAELLEREGMSLTAAADHFGVRERTIERWIKEETGVPDDVKRKFCARFKCSVEHLMGWDRSDSKAVV